MRRKLRGYRLIGSVGVDAGLVWVGDPCYILHTPLPTDMGTRWEEFCDIYSGHPVTDQPEAPLPIVRRGRCFAQFEAGVCVNTADGDGDYPVFAKYGDSVLNKDVIVELRIPLV
jgi:hypothetical protein